MDPWQKKMNKPKNSFVLRRPFRWPSISWTPLPLSPPKNFRKTKNGLSAYKQKLPEYADEQEAHLKQLAFYYKATGKTPYLVYVNHEEYKIFKPEIPQLEYYYQQMVNKAFIIQNILELTEADMSKITQLCEPPDLKSFYYSDLTKSQLEEVKKAWRM